MENTRNSRLFTTAAATAAGAATIAAAATAGAGTSTGAGTARGATAGAAAATTTAGRIGTRLTSDEGRGAVRTFILQSYTLLRRKHTQSNLVCVKPEPNSGAQGERYQRQCARLDAG